MKFLPKIVFTAFLFLFFITPAHAQIPKPYVPCDKIDNPEFHSLRPYQASPCDDEVKETVIACGNDLIAQKKFKVTPAGAKSCKTNPDGTQTCEFEIPSTVDVTITLPDAELPILGNTQLVNNSQSRGSLNDAQKVNEYVSWYLNGTAFRAEDEMSDRFIDFSGPLRKLLPLEIVHQEQVKTIFAREVKRHDQIVVCGKKKYLFGLIGKAEPHECYEGDGSPAKDEYRLSEWDKDLSLLNSFWNRIGGDNWNHRYPPLEKDFAKRVEFQKAYNEWRGKSCIIIPVTELLICLENPLITNEYADLFPYVPLSSTEDRTGKVVADISTTEQPGGNGVSVKEVKFDPKNNENIVYFAHTEEVADSSSLLQKTYIPQGSSGITGATTSDNFFNTKRCDLNNVRWNSGDDLFGEYGNRPIEGKLSYKAAFSCDFPKPSLTLPNTRECEKEVNVALSVYTKSPKINEIWDRLVGGGQSIFKKIYPVEFAQGILDLPAVTTARYTSNADKTLAGDPKNNRSGERAEIFIPHLGGIQEYFLKGIQTALRPKGFGEQIESRMPTSGPVGSKDIRVVAEKYNIPYCQLKGIEELETGGNTNIGNGSCSTNHGAFPCCRGLVCGPFQIACNQYNGFAGDDQINMCDPAGGAELAARAMLLKLCQADGNCNSYDWVKWGDYVTKNYKVKDGDYTATAYFYGLQNGCYPSACTQYRWGPGKSYCDAVKSYCESNHVLPDKTSPAFCGACNIELKRAGQTPTSCSDL